MNPERMHPTERATELLINDLLEALGVEFTKDGSKFRTSTGVLIEVWYPVNRPFDVRIKTPTSDKLYPVE